MPVFHGEAVSNYTAYMDSVRFGRALGIGARAAAKTLVTAADAVVAPNPSAKAATKPASETGSTERDVPTQIPAGSHIGQQAAHTAVKAIQTKDGLRQGGKRFGQAVWGPVVKLSGVLWLEVTGVLFGIFALFAIGGAWKMRSEMYTTSSSHDGHMRFVGAAVMAVIFAYFCMSSFVKANRRGNGR